MTQMKKGNDLGARSAACAGKDRGDGVSRFSLALFAIVLAACSPKGEALYARAEQALDKGETRVAVLDLRSLVKDDPENAKARALFGRALVENGELQEGNVETQKARELGAEPEWTLVAECRLLLAQTAYDDIEQRCLPGSAAAGDRAEILALRGQALMQAGNVAEARELLTEALAAEPGHLDALIGLAGLEFREAGLPAARKVLEGASGTIQSRSRYWFARGSLEMQAADYPAAEKSFDKAAELAAKGAGLAERLPALASLAEAQLRQGRIEEAGKTTDRMLKSAPKSPMAQTLAAQVAAAGGDLDKARILLEDTLTRSPDNLDARMLLGMVNMQLGNLGQAEMHLGNVVTTQPGNARAQALLAEVRSRSGSAESSLAALKPALEQSGGDPELLALASRLSLASGDREQALDYLSRASASAANDEDPGARLDVAAGYMLAGEFDKAIELLESLPEATGGDHRRDYLLLLSLLRSGDTDAAVKEARALVARAGSDPVARNLAAGVFGAAGLPDEARAQLEEIQRIKPDDVGSILSLGRLDLLQGKPDDARKRFEQVLKIDATNLPATMGLAVIASAKRDVTEAEKWLRKATTDHPEATDATLALAQFYIGAKDYGKARDTLSAAAQRSPNNAAIVNMQGLVQLADGDAQGAATRFKEALRLDPRGDGYALNLARVQVLAGSPDDALATIDGLLQRNAQFQPGLAFGAATSLQAGKVERAAGYVERLRRVAPDAQGTAMLEGDLAMAQRRYKDALESYRKAAAKGGSSTLVLAQARAGRLAGVQDPDKPLRDWLADNTQDSRVRTMLAEQRVRDGDVSGAVKVYEDGVAGSPNDPILLNNLAVLYDRRGDKRALATAERAYESGREAPEIQDTYGWLLVRQGDLDRGLALLQSAADGAPKLAEVQYHLAWALAKKGRQADALVAARKAADLPASADVKADISKLIAELE